MDLRKRFPKYATLLYLYPAVYRRQYDEQMLQTLADMLDDAHTHKTAVWVLALLDLPLSALKQQINHIGVLMNNDSPIPSYVKNSALIGVALLLPFFSLVAAHTLDARMQHSIFWHYHILFTFFVLMPSAAFLLTATALISWLIERHKQEKKSWSLELFDLRRNWYLLTILFIGIGIVGMVYGHDSVHCITGKPISEVRNTHQTLACIVQR